MSAAVKGVGGFAAAPAAGIGSRRTSLHADAPHPAAAAVAAAAAVRPHAAGAAAPPAAARCGSSPCGMEYYDCG